MWKMKNEIELLQDSDLRAEIVYVGLLSSACDSLLKYCVKKKAWC
jgi:hypothetical protein